ncbi:MAG: hypothetical protein R3F17_14590 [Planctomycetota bacterium]
MTTLAQPRPGLDARRAALRAHLAELGRLAVAFSGGVDSSALLAEAVAVLGDGALAVIADSPSLPRRELIEARRIATQLGARLVEVRTTEGNNPAYQANLGNRCYFCKFALFDAMQAVCAEHKVPWMAFGEITDDFRDHRPGAQAAARSSGLWRRSLRRTSTRPTCAPSPPPTAWKSPTNPPPPASPHASPSAPS